VKTKSKQKLLGRGSAKEKKKKPMKLAEKG